MRRHIVIGTGIAATVVLLLAIAAAVRPWMTQKRDLKTQVLGRWQELESKAGTRTFLEFTHDGRIHIWEGVGPACLPTRTERFSIKNDTLVIAEEEGWAPRLRIEGDLLAIETNSIIWFKRTE